MTSSLGKRIWRFAAAAALVLGAAFGATTSKAALVVGTWDPAFGPALPNMSWQARSAWLVPNACTNAADGVYSTSQIGGPCENVANSVRLVGIWVRWFDTVGGDPNNFFELDAFGAYTGMCELVYATTDPDCSLFNVAPYNFSLGSEPLVASNVRVAQQQVAGFDTGITSFITQNQPVSAGTHQFDLSFTTNGPVFTCRNKLSAPFTPGTDTSCDTPVNAINSDLSQFVVTYTSNDTSTPKFTNAEGQAIGLRLDGAGNVIPEPALPALVACGLALLCLSRRRVA